MPTSATYRAKVGHSILFVRIVNRYFFRRRHFRSFDDGSVRIKGEKTLELSVCYRNKCLRLSSEKFVSAGGSNLSLVTGQTN